MFACLKEREKERMRRFVHMCSRAGKQETEFESVFRAVDLLRVLSYLVVMIETVDYVQPLA